MTSRVDRVTDGDTVVLDDGTRVRLFGIDAPETHPRLQPYGAEAASRLEELLENAGWKVDVEVRDRDRRYGRTVAVLYSYDGRASNEPTNLNLLLVREGLAWAYGKYIKDVDERNEYENAEREAKRTRRGLWASDDAVNPEAFRREGRTKGRKKRPVNRNRNRSRSRSRNSESKRVGVDIDVDIGVDIDVDIDRSHRSIRIVRLGRGSGTGSRVERNLPDTRFCAQDDVRSSTPRSSFFSFVGDRITDGFVAIGSFC